jgi:F-type H+-transporting ATPase subunit a
MATSGILLFILHPFPVLVVFVLVGLEVAVAVIQAYVFAMLTCLYIHDAINLH